MLLPYKLMKQILFQNLGSVLMITLCQKLNITATKRKILVLNMID